MRASWIVLFVAVILLGGMSGRSVTAEVRTWTDSTGDHTVEAEMVGLDGDRVRLKRADGREITIPLRRLSEADRQFATGAQPAIVDNESSPESERELVSDASQSFYEDLRTKTRTEALGLLTRAGRELDEASSVHDLPKPTAGSRSIIVGDPAIDGDTAEIPVKVRVNKESVDTTLHLRREEGEWRVAAISAEVGGEVRTIDFEKPSLARRPDPLPKLVGKPLPIEGFTLDGEPFSSERYAGKVVLVDFWATWCAPCRAEMPNILASYEKHHEEGFEVVAVSVDRDLTALANFVDKEQPPWTILADQHPKTKESLSQRYRIPYLPSLILVGRSGVVEAVKCRGGALDTEVTKALRKRFRPASSEVAAQSFSRSLSRLDLNSHATLRLLNQ